MLARSVASPRTPSSCREAKPWGLRGAQINNCTYCLDVHHRAARDIAIPSGEDRLPHGLVGDPAVQCRGGRSAGVRRGAHPRRRHHLRQAFQRYHDSLALHFDETAMLEIVGVVVNMNVWTRLKLAQGAMPV